MTDPLRHFAELSGGELASIITPMFAAFAALLVGFYKFAEKQMRESREERSEERRAMAEAVNNLARKIDADILVARELVTETRKGNVEAEKRNGHLAELTIEARSDVLAALEHIKKQDVREQHVGRQVIERKVKKK